MANTLVNNSDYFVSILGMYSTSGYRANIPTDEHPTRLSTVLFQDLISWPFMAHLAQNKEYYSIKLNMNLCSSFSVADTII